MEIHRNFKPTAATVAKMKSLFEFIGDDDGSKSNTICAAPKLEDSNNFKVKAEVWTQEIDPYTSGKYIRMKVLRENEDDKRIASLQIKIPVSLYKQRLMEGAIYKFTGKITGGQTSVNREPFNILSVNDFEFISDNGKKFYNKFLEQSKSYKMKSSRF